MKPTAVDTAMVVFVLGFAFGAATGGVLRGPNTSKVSSGRAMNERKGEEPSGGRNL